MLKILFILSLIGILIITYYVLPKILGIDHSLTKEKRKLGVFTVQVSQILHAIEFIKTKTLKAKIGDFHFIDIKEDKISLRIKKEHFIITLRQDKHFKSNYYFEVESIRNNRSEKLFQFSIVKDVFNDVIQKFIILKDLLKTKKEELNSYLAENQNRFFSDKPEDYNISIDDFKRNNEVDSAYRKENLLFLLQLFNNQCANCGDMDNGVDLDHFFISKNKGGNFSLAHKSGQLINNAIPLCRSCNRQKSDNNYIEFFSTPKLFEILEKNELMTQRINEK
jgi:5-methylcytosine-specific restriction endonuclease McrA